MPPSAAECRGLEALKTHEMFLRVMTAKVSSLLVLSTDTNSMTRFTDFLNGGHAQCPIL